MLALLSFATAGACEPRAVIIVLLPGNPHVIPQTTMSALQDLQDAIDKTPASTGGDTTGTDTGNPTGLTVDDLDNINADLHAKAEQLRAKNPAPAPAAGDAQPAAGGQ